MTVRPPGDESAVLAKVRDFGLRRRETGRATEREFAERLAEMFAEVCADEPARQAPRGFGSRGAA
jgi:hypothetical protein